MKNQIILYLCHRVFHFFKNNIAIQNTCGGGIKWGFEVEYQPTIFHDDQIKKWQFAIKMPTIDFYFFPKPFVTFC